MYNYNPYNTYSMYGQQQPPQQQLPRQEIIHVNGEGGARAYQLAPNSNSLLLDDTASIVWLVQTDGAGYKTVTPYTITPYKHEPQVDTKSLEDRIKRLEELYESNIKTTNATTIE